MVENMVDVAKAQESSRHDLGGSHCSSCFRNERREQRHAGV